MIELQIQNDNFTAKLWIFTWELESSGCKMVWITVKPQRTKKIKPLASHVILLIVKCLKV